MQGTVSTNYINLQLVLKWGDPISDWKSDLHRMKLLMHRD